VGPLLGIGREVFRIIMEPVDSGKPMTGSVYQSPGDDRRRW